MGEVAVSTGAVAAQSAEAAEGATGTLPGWVQIGYLLAAVCFIVALKGLSSPRTARAGNFIGGAVLRGNKPASDAWK